MKQAYGALNSSVTYQSNSAFSELHRTKMVESDLHDTNGGDTEPTPELKQRKLANYTVKYQANGLPASKV